ncbi:MAG: sulfur carrier protein ThiS [Thermodesulfobacteriota bacterium]
MITITCNGETRRLAGEMSVEELICSLDLNPETVVAELDGRILNRSEYAVTKLAEGATLELIRFVGGG